MFRPGPPSDERELPSRFRFGDFEVDLPTARLHRAGETVALEPRAFDLLLLLAANPLRVVEKEEILARLWGKAFVTDNALTRVVAHLRQALGDRADRPGVIETVRTRGYRFLPEIVAATQPAADTTPGPAAGRRPLSGGRRARWRLLGWGAALAALAVLGLLLRDRGRTYEAAPPQLSLVQRTMGAGNQLFPRFSPDGSHLVYASDEGDSVELFVMTVDGGTPLQITRGGPNTEPAWSPDGRWIAYRSLSRGGLWLVDPTGGETRQLTDFGTQPAWSPDGRTLVFSHPGKPTLGATEWPVTYDSTLWLADVATGATRPLTELAPETGGQGAPAFTPDGRFVVFVTANVAEGGSVWRVPAAGGQPEALVAPGGGVPPGDGDAPDPEGVHRAPIYHDPCPLPDGSGAYLLVAGVDSRILRLRWDGPVRLEPVLAPAPVGAAHLTLSRSGERLAFAVQRTETRIEEVRVGADGTIVGTPRPLVAPQTRRVTGPSYSPDGRWLLFRLLSSGRGPSLVVVDTDGRQVTKIEGTAAAAWVSPTEVVVGPFDRGLRVDLVSGRRRPWRPYPDVESAFALARPRRVAVHGDMEALAFTRPRKNGRDLWLWRREWSESRRMTRLSGWIDYPAWSRDGRWIAFQLAPRLAVDNELWRIPAAGGVPEHLPVGKGPSWGAAFDPTGERVVYAALRDGSWRLAVAGPGQPERLLDVPPETTGYLRWPDWSPDGGRIAYERMRYQSTLWTVDLPPDAGVPAGR